MSTISPFGLDGNLFGVWSPSDHLQAPANTPTNTKASYQAFFSQTPSFSPPLKSRAKG